MVEIPAAVVLDTIACEPVAVVVKATMIEKQRDELSLLPSSFLLLKLPADKKAQSICSCLQQRLPRQAFLQLDDDLAHPESP